MERLTEITIKFPSSEDEPLRELCELVVTELSYFGIKETEAAMGDEDFLASYERKRGEVNTL